MTVYGVGVGVSEAIRRGRYSAKVQRVTHSYYDGILTAYTPAIDHGQDSDRGGRCGLRLKVRVRKVTNLTPRRNGVTPGEKRM